MEQLAEILTVDHIDVFFVAPSDLAQTMSYVGQPRKPLPCSRWWKGAAPDCGRRAGSPARSVPMHDAGATSTLAPAFFLTSYDPWIKAGAQAYQAQLAALQA
ncbi:MAG: hypothetical protein R3E79_26610 [Caldilineaceae bacterium]